MEESKTLADVSSYLAKSLSNRADKNELISKKIFIDPDSMQFRKETLMIKLKQRRTPQILAQLNVIKEYDADTDLTTGFGSAKEQLEKAMKKDKLNTFFSSRPSQESVLRRRVIVDEAEVLENKNDLKEFGEVPQPMRASYTSAEMKILSPKKMFETMSFESCGCGWAHTVLKDRSGNLHSVGNGSNGRLGNGTHNHATSLTHVEKVEECSMISISDNHNMGIWSGKVYTWGDGSWSKLGHGTVDDCSVPTLVEALNHETVVQVAAGGYHSLALTDKGQVYGWGWAKNGRLGVSIEEGSEEVISSPKLIPIGDNLKIIKVAAGQSASAAISEDGKLYVWGHGRWGALGLGESEEDQSFPTLLESLQEEHVVEAVVGDSHMLIRTKSERIYSWGRNDYGQLGRSDLKQDGTPGLVNIPDDQTKQVQCLAAGKSHSLVIVDGKLYSWGNNSAGQLGLGSTGKEYKPRHVSGLSGRPVFVGTGWSHTVVVVEDGCIFGFGSNLKNQLGSQ